MKIESIEIKFSRVGVNTFSPQVEESNSETKKTSSVKSAMYLVVANIKCAGERHKKRIYLQGMVKSKQDIKDVLAGDDYLVLGKEDKYLMFDLEGNLNGEYTKSEYGELVWGSDEAIILLKGRTATWVNKQGVIAGSRTLSDDEYTKFKG